MKGREEGKRSSFQTIALLMAIPLAGMAVFFLWQWWNDGITPEQAYEDVRHAVPGKHAAPSSHEAVAVPKSAAEDALPRVTPKARHRRGEIVLIIDDLGFEGQPLDRVMKLDPNVNCAVLPNGTSADDVARKLHSGGFEILCHLPMQPQGNEQPGRNAILTSMSDEEIERTTRENIAAIPYARGVNNHMGSRATTDRRVMTSVMRGMPEGLYFIDSRTTGGSVAATVAREMNVRTATRQVFLDDVATERSVRRQVSELADAAEKHGVAIGIGHPYAVTMKVLAEELPELRAQGFRLIRASEAVR